MTEADSRGRITTEGMHVRSCNLSGQAHAKSQCHTTLVESNKYICVIESVVYYVAPKSPGSLGFLGGKEQVRLPLTEEYYSLEVLKKHIVAHAGLKTEAKKRGLGSSIELCLKLCRLEKTAEGSKAFSINTQAQWVVERPLFGNSSVLQGGYYF